jgi:phosphatidate cytidylyltransferase
MAFDKKTFRIRTASSLVFIAIMLAGLMISNWTFFILFTIIHFGCWQEYQRLVGLIDKEYLKITPFHRYGVMIAGWCIMLYFTSDQYYFFGLRLHELGWWVGLLLVFVLPIMELLFTMNIRLKNIGYSALGLLYLSLSLGLMIDLGSDPGNTITGNETDIAPGSLTVARFYPLIIMLTLWINDTMAYLVGSFIGKTSLSRISPKKTWEGTIGGMVLAIVVIGLSAYYFFGLPLIHAFIITGIIAVTGTFGDLLESKLKRSADVKDSGRLMPGHGGFLDRFDSFLVATPFVWLYVELFLKSR